MSDHRRIILGAMSGTSADGVDVAVVRIEGRGIGMTCQLLRHHHRLYEPVIRAAIFAARSVGAIALDDLAKLGRAVSLSYAAACRQAMAGAAIGPADVTAIAAHGQTLYHAPPDTIQWFDPSLLAAKTGCAVVSDFRRADCAVGGQGAPLVPFADYLLFRGESLTRVLLNIGGIANLTYLPVASTIDHLIAFDTGPGNCISDYLARKLLAGGIGWDAGGGIAAMGTAIGSVIERVLADEYFLKAPPKSTDGPAMIRLFEDAVATEDHAQRPENLLRTACELSAESITMAIRRLPGPKPDEVIVSGGGTKNATLMRLLSQRLERIPLRTTDEFGVPGDAKEALAFALLGAANLDGEPANVPSVTGAKRRIVLGSVTRGI